jgi:phosphoribosylamine---glycine ligase
MSERKTVLIVDAPSGRRAALADAYLQSDEVERVLITGGNETLLSVPEEKELIPFPEVDHRNPDQVTQLAKEFEVHIADVAQDNSVEQNVAGYLRQSGFRTLGPDKAAGRLEWSKSYGRSFAVKNGIPIPEHISFSRVDSDLQKARNLVDGPWRDVPLAVKLDGLYEGKGVKIVRTREEKVEALEWITKVGPAGERFLLEKLIGGANAQEISGFYLGWVKNGEQQFTELGFAQDYKRVGVNDTGENTGGMGCINTFPWLDRLRPRIEKEIVEPTARGLNRTKTPYVGVLYFGMMYDPDPDQLSLIEYNSRWGDPEAEVIIPSMTPINDYFRLSQSAAVGDVIGGVEKIDSVYLSAAAISLGYPGDYTRVKTKDIYGIEDLRHKLSMLNGSEDLEALYGAGIAKDSEGYKVAGGRIFHLVTRAQTIPDARAAMNREMSYLYVPGDRAGENLLTWRPDIGLKQVMLQDQR